MYQPWVAHYFPGLRITDMELIGINQYIGLWDTFQASTKTSS